jgi:hypothetical protein
MIETARRPYLWFSTVLFSNCSRDRRPYAIGSETHSEKWSYCAFSFGSQRGPSTIALATV